MTGGRLLRGTRHGMRQEPRQPQREHRDPPLSPAPGRGGIRGEGGPKAGWEAGGEMCVQAPIQPPNREYSVSIGALA